MNKIIKTNLKQEIYLIFFILMFSLVVTSCRKNDNSDNEGESAKPMDELVVDPQFKWETAKNISVKIITKDNQNEVLPNAIVKVYTDFPEDGGLLMLKGVTDENGEFQSTRPIPKYLNEIVLATEQIGLVNFVKIPVVDNEVEYTFGGKINLYKSSVSLIPKSTNSSIKFLGTYNNQGVPDYLEPENDIISADFLQDINNSLPERQHVGNVHPEYLSLDYEHDLLLECGASVWVTFIHEGAGYKNVLGFYTYNINSPPATSDDIDTITIIYPNVSYQGSGGGLQSGNKVKIGEFPDNTGIGWVLIANGWSNGTVTDGYNYYYSDRDFNPESDPELKQHSVIIYDPGRELMILGFEDIQRDNQGVDPSSCDHDFNDAIFYITVDPNPCTILDFPVIDYTGSDSDNDGVSDYFDDYPDNTNYAFNNYYPCSVEFGTLAFEDLWPGVGDYDFNDLVLDYQFNQITNGNNRITHIDAKLVVVATGAYFLNGFGFQLPIASTDVTNVSGYDLQENYITLDPSNNLEAGQSKATVIVYDNSFNILPDPGGPGIGVNTAPEKQYVNPDDTLNISIDLANVFTSEELGSPPYNPFLIVNEQRDYEVHLPDFAPTDLADKDLFGTKDDDSDPGTGRYYKTYSNLPWAINLFYAFDYPIEKTQINQAHLKFTDWAESNGSIRNDWYLDLPDYRDDDKIYSKPAQ